MPKIGEILTTDVSGEVRELSKLEGCNMGFIAALVDFFGKLGKGSAIASTKTGSVKIAWESMAPVAQAELRSVLSEDDIGNVALAMLLITDKVEHAVVDIVKAAGVTLPDVAKQLEAAAKDRSLDPQLREVIEQSLEACPPPKQSKLSWH